MTLKEKIDDWMKHPNALGSESQAAVIVGAVAAARGERTPDEVQKALKVLALRGTMRDIASQIQREEAREPGLPSFHEIIVDVGAASCGLSWAEALATITRYLQSGETQTA